MPFWLIPELPTAVLLPVSDLPVQKKDWVSLKHMPLSVRTYHKHLGSLGFALGFVSFIYFHVRWLENGSKRSLRPLKVLPHFHY